MENWSTEKLISEITELQEKLSFYQAKLRDLVSAYKSLIKEKEALELSVKALQNVCQSEKTQENKTDLVEKSNENVNSEEETVQSQININSDVTTLMNSLATLSAEKSRMEASFQADKKKLRQEKEKNENYIKELKDKLKKNTTDTSREIEQLKSKLIIEKHEREKEQNDLVVMMSELQNLLSKEREEKMQLEKQLSEIAPKFQLLENKEEVERHKELDMKEKFVDLQKKHLEMLEEERKRIQQTEYESKEQVMIHEQRVVNLETRLSELSLTVANYHRLRQQDQNEITKLKAHIAELLSQKKVPHECQEENEIDLLKNCSESELSAYVNKLIGKMMKYRTLLSKVNKQLGKPMEVNTILCDSCASYETNSVNLDVHKKLLNEYELLMKRFKESSKTVDEIENFEIKIQVLQDRNTVLTSQIEETIQKYELQLESRQKELDALKAKHIKEVDTLHSINKNQIIELENQLKKQRDRTVALLEEKEQEVSTLKSSFQIFLPTGPISSEVTNTFHSVPHSQLSGVLDENNLDADIINKSPHILHYAHELARKDVNVANMRKSCYQLELMIHKANKELILYKEKSNEEVKKLKEEVTRLQRCQSREGVNLEYLKNVIVNYFLSQSTSKKRHMFNAIATILKFSDSEVQMINSSELHGLLK